MSIKSFINGIWARVQSLFNNFPASLQSAVHIGVTVTENIKLFVDSPLADVLTAIIPGELDDTLKAVLRKELPVILVNLKLAENCGSITDPQLITKCAVQTLQNLDSVIKSVFLHNLSVMISQLAADGKLTWSEGVCIAEWYYKQKFKKVA